MNQNKIVQPNVLEIATMRFKTVVAQVKADQAVTLELPVESGINGFIVFLGSSTFVMGSHGWITWYGLLWQSNGLEGQTA